MPAADPIIIHTDPHHHSHRLTSHERLSEPDDPGAGPRLPCRRVRHCGADTAWPCIHVWHHCRVGGMAQPSAYGGAHAALYPRSGAPALPSCGERCRAHGSRLEPAAHTVGTRGHRVQTQRPCRYDAPPVGTRHHGQSLLREIMKVGKIEKKFVELFPHSQNLFTFASAIPHTLREMLFTALARMVEG